MKSKLSLLILGLGIVLLTASVNGGCGQNQAVSTTTTTTSSTTSSSSSSASTTSTSSTTTSRTSTVTTSTTTTTIRPILLAPEGLQAQSNGSYVELTWLASASSNLSGYKVYRMGLGGAGFELIATLGTDLSYQDSTVNTGQTYLYSVKAYNSDQESDFSLAAMITFVIIDTMPPFAPTFLNAVPDTTTVFLTWQANSETDLAGYNIYRKAEDEPLFYKINGSLIITNSYTDSLLASNKTYQYKVTAADTSSNESEPSNILSVKTLAASDITAPAAPTGLTASGSEYQVNLSWDANSEADLHHYNLYRSTKAPDGIETSYYRYSNILTNSYLDEDVSNGTTYYYQVTAVDNSGNESTKSAEMSATPVSSIDDNAVIRSQLSVYEQGMRNMDVAQVMSTISDDYLDTYYVYGSTYTYYKSDYQNNLEDDFAMKNYTSYALTITNVSIIRRTASVTAKIELAAAGKNSPSHDYTGTYITALINKTFSLAREGDTWRITRDKADKEIGFESVPWTSKPGYNLMYQAIILLFDNNNNFSNYLKSAFAQDPSGNPISFSSGFLGLVGYGTVEAGDYSTNVVLTDKGNHVYNFTHNYKVLPSTGSLSALSVRPIDYVKWIKLILDHKIK